MSMSRVPWSTFARCRLGFGMVDIRPPIENDGRHSTIDLSRAGIPGHMSNDDFSRSHLSSGLMARFAAPSVSSPDCSWITDHLTYNSVPVVRPVKLLKMIVWRGGTRSDRASHHV